MIKRLLIVDDDPYIRKIIKDAFSQENYSIVGEATNGLQAVNQYNELKPDFVTMDISMPQQNGIDALKEIITDNPDAQIIMCSSMGTDKIIENAIQLGAKDFITKPFEIEELLTAASKLFI